MAAAMNAQDTFRLDGRVVFLSGPGGYLGREVGIALGNAGATLVLSGCNPGRFETPRSRFGRLRTVTGDGGRQMDGLVG